MLQDSSSWRRLSEELLGPSLESASSSLKLTDWPVAFVGVVALLCCCCEWCLPFCVTVTEEVQMDSRREGASFAF